VVDDNSPDDAWQAARYRAAILQRDPGRRCYTASSLTPDDIDTVVNAIKECRAGQ
jgi:hypothetical protein